MIKKIEHRFSFPYPPEMVWEYLTKPELMELWLMKTNFRPVIDTDFQFRTNPIPSLDFDGVVHCKVLEIVPFKKLSYSWQCGPGGGKITLESVVAWQLEATDIGTELFLEHSGFSKEENLSFFTGMRDGWLKNIRKIADHLKAVPYDNIKA